MDAIKTFTTELAAVRSKTNELTESRLRIENRLMSLETTIQQQKEESRYNMNRLLQMFETLMNNEGNRRTNLPRPDTTPLLHTPTVVGSATEDNAKTIVCENTDEFSNCGVFKVLDSEVSDIHLLTNSSHELFADKVVGKWKGNVKSDWVFSSLRSTNFLCTPSVCQNDTMRLCHVPAVHFQFLSLCEISIVGMLLYNRCGEGFMIIEVNKPPPLPPDTTLGSLVNACLKSWKDEEVEAKKREAEKERLKTDHISVFCIAMFFALSVQVMRGTHTADNRSLIPEVNVNLDKDQQQQLTTLFANFHLSFGNPKGLLPPEPYDHQIRMQVKNVDMLIYVRTWIAHIQHLAQVFNTLMYHSFVAMPSKRTLAQTRVQYLGHITSSNGMEVDGRKSEAVREWPQPENTKPFTRFQELNGYYVLHISVLKKYPAKPSFHHVKWHVALINNRTAIETVAFLCTHKVFLFLDGIQFKQVLVQWKGEGQDSSNATCEDEKHFVEDFPTLKTPQNLIHIITTILWVSRELETLENQHIQNGSICTQNALGVVELVMANVEASYKCSLVLCFSLPRSPDLKIHFINLEDKVFRRMEECYALEKGRIVISYYD